VSVLRGLFRGDVLEHHLEFGEVAAQRDHLLVDEHGFAVEQVDVGRGHFTVHQQQQPGSLHGFQRLVRLADVGDASVAVGGGAGRVQLEGHHTSILRARDLVGRQVVGQIQRHQGLEARALGHGGTDAVAVGHSLRRGGHGRLEVGHDDRAAELGGGVRDHGAQGVAVPHVQVPVVRTGDCEGVGGGDSRSVHPPIVANRPTYMVTLSEGNFQKSRKR